MGSMMMIAQHSTKDVTGPSSQHKTLQIIC